MGFVGGAVATALSYTLTVSQTPGIVADVDPSVRNFPDLRAVLRTPRGFPPGVFQFDILQAWHSHIAGSGGNHHGESRFTVAESVLTFSCHPNGGRGKLLLSLHLSSAPSISLLSPCSFPPLRPSTKSQPRWVWPVRSAVVICLEPVGPGRPSGPVAPACLSACSSQLSTGELYSTVLDSI